MQEHLENYMRMKLDPTALLKLKKGVLPHLFNCQADRNRFSSKPSKPGMQKLAKIRIFKEIEAEENEKAGAEPEDKPESESRNLKEDTLNNNFAEPIFVDENRLPVSANEIKKIVEEEKIKLVRKMVDINIQTNLKPSRRSKTLMCTN